MSGKGEIMKVQKYNEKQKSRLPAENHGKRLWKIIAISFIVIFVLFIAVGVAKVYRYKSSLVKPTQDQIGFVTKIAADRLRTMGVNLTGLQVHEASKIRKLHEADAERSVMQITFSSSALSHTFLVDANTGEILMHSQTEIFVPFGEHDKRRRRGPEFQGHGEFK